MPFLHNYTQKSIILRKIHLGLLLFPHLYFVSVTTKTKLNLENDRMLQLVTYTSLS